MTYLDDTLSDDDMLAWLSSRYDGDWTTNALGETLIHPADHYWRQDLIGAEQQLKHLLDHRPLLERERVIRPAAFGSEAVVLAADPLLHTLTELYTVLVAMFRETDVGRHYKPSPRATRFLWAFGDCAYLQEVGFHQPPVLSPEQADQVLDELNQRLQAWYQSTRQADFNRECYRNRRNSAHNHEQICRLIGGLFERHSRLLVLRVDLAYTAFDMPTIDYETARYHREQLCRAFHTDSLFQHMVGYAWKLEWQPQKGFHYHWLFFFDGHQCREDITVAQRIGELWAGPITGRQGLYFTIPDLPEDYADSRQVKLAMGEPRRRLIRDARILCKQRGITQGQMADELGISKRTLEEWMQFRRMPQAPSESLLRQWVARYSEEGAGPGTPPC